MSSQICLCVNICQIQAIFFSSFYLLSSICFCCTGWSTCRTTTRATAWWPRTSRWRGTCPATSTSSTSGPWLRWVFRKSAISKFPDCWFHFPLIRFQPPKSSTGNGANPSDKVALVLHRQVLNLKYQFQSNSHSRIRMKPFSAIFFSAFQDQLLFKIDPFSAFQDQLFAGLYVKIDLFLLFKTNFSQGFTSCFRPLGMTCSTNGGKISVDELFPELFRWFWYWKNLKKRGSNENFPFFVSEENLKEDQMETPLCLYCVWAGYQKFDICFQGCTTHWLYFKLLFSFLLI